MVDQVPVVFVTTSGGLLKYTLKQATKAQRGSRGIALFFL